MGGRAKKGGGTLAGGGAGLLSIGCEEGHTRFFVRPCRDLMQKPDTMRGLDSSHSAGFHPTRFLLTRFRTSYKA